MLCYLFSFYLHVWNSPSQKVNPHHLLIYIFQNFPWETAAIIYRDYLKREYVAGICRGTCRKNLPRLFATKNCRRNWPWLFAVRICRRNICRYLPYVFCVCKQMIFGICEQVLFVWKQTFFICEQNFFNCEIFYINSVSFCYCHGSYGMGHRIILA